MNIFRLFLNIKKFANTSNEHSPFINFLLTYSSFLISKNLFSKNEPRDALSNREELKANWASMLFQFQPIFLVT